MGVISVKDALATGESSITAYAYFAVQVIELPWSVVTKAMMKNLAEYAEEERMKEIEEREGYSE